MTRRLATIDIGTNSVLLLAAEARDDGTLVPLAERMEITRLGRGVDTSGMLAPEALDDTLAAVEEFAREARALGCSAVYATATSAARDAKNGHVLIERAAQLGVPVEIIAGQHEAQLSWNAVAADFARHDAPLAVIDIGGGSTEIILGRGTHMEWRHSFDVGSVRLTERHLRGDPPTPESLAELERVLGSVLHGVPTPTPGTRVVGIAGTYTTIASISLGMHDWDATKVHGLELPRGELDTIAHRLAGKSLAERKTIAGLAPKRADVIVAGAFLAAACVRALGAETVTIGDRGVRWGYLAEKLAGT